MTNNTIEIGTISIINSSLASLASQIEEVMKSRDEKIAEINASIEEMNTEISKREIEISKKLERLAVLKGKRATAEAELNELNNIVNPFEKSSEVIVSAPSVEEKSVMEVTPIKEETIAKSTLVSTSFSGKVLPAYDGKNDLRVKHPDGRMCFIKEGEAEVGKEYLFDILNESSYGTSYKVKVLSEVLTCGIFKEETIELPVVKVESRGSLDEDSNAICYSSGEELKNTPFAKLFANMKK